MINYPTLNTSLSFTDYVQQSRQLIAANRPDLLNTDPTTHQLILDANSPFELIPDSQTARKPYTHGILLVHGLLDCPFSLRDIAKRLHTEGMLCRAILLPGHGTHPKDLLNVSYQDWADVVNYGVESLRKDAEKIYIIGYSTGAALALQHAFRHEKIAGIISLAPAIKIKISAALIIAWHYLLHVLMNDKVWLFRHAEIDYSKYLSITYNAVHQVSSLTKEIEKDWQEKKLPCPLFMALSEDDETISAKKALEFFTKSTDEKSRLLFYTSHTQQFSDKRIHIHTSVYPDFAIKNFSHVSIPFAQDNPHYGQRGDYKNASHLPAKNKIYGAYNYVQVKLFHFLQTLKLIKTARAELTYNPDFDFMSKEILKFIQNN